MKLQGRICIEVLLFVNSVVAGLQLKHKRTPSGVFLGTCEIFANFFLFYIKHSRVST